MGTTRSAFQRGHSIFIIKIDKIVYTNIRNMQKSVRYRNLEFGRNTIV